MGRIVVYGHPLDTEPSRDEPFTGPLIDWLREHYPRGFGSRALVSVNSQRLDVADYDAQIGAADEVRITLIPGVAAALAAVGITGWWAVAASAVISVAASYAINALFATKPDKPKSLADTPAPSPTYSLGPPQVTARLGEPIPVQYGRVIAVPDVASQPYSWYESNEQYLFMLLCLGAGEFAVHDLFISDTPASQIAHDVIAYEVFPPSRHAQTAGTISTVMHVWEDVDTSVEVSDQELLRDPAKAEVYEALLHFGTPDYIDLPGSGAPAEIVAGSIIGVAHVAYVGGIPASLAWTEYTVDSVSGDRKRVYLIEDAGSSGDSVTRDVVGSVSVNEAEHTASLTTEPAMDKMSHWDGSPVHVVQRGTSAITELDDITIATQLSGTVSAGHDLYIVDLVGGGDPTPVLGNVYLGNTLSAASTASDAELTTRLPRGQVGNFTATLYAADHNSLSFTNMNGTVSEQCESIVVTLTGQTVNVDWNPPDAVVGPYAICAPHRRAISAQCDVVFPGGLYTGNDDGTLGSATVGLEFAFEEIDDDGDPVVPANTTTLTEYITAATNTPQRRSYWCTLPNVGRWRVSAERITPSSSRAQDQSRCVWTGLKGFLALPSGPVYGDTTILGVRLRATNGIASDAARRLTVDCTRLIDGTATSSAAVAVADLWTNDQYGAGRDGAELDGYALAAMSASGAVFNARFDKPVALWQALGHITRPGYWFPAPIGAQITFVRDAPINTVSRALTDDQVADLRLSYRFDAADAVDGIEIEYRDYTSGEAQYVRYPLDSVQPDRQVLFGCTDEDAAEAFAEAQWTRQKYRRRLVEFTTELDGHLLEIGSRVSLDHPLTGAVDLLIQSVTPTDEHHCSVSAYVYDARAYG